MKSRLRKSKEGCERDKAWWCIGMGMDLDKKQATLRSE
jgi:hypothetical protein